LEADGPAARRRAKAILADMAVAPAGYQVEALHARKLVSLGTLAAGLMHELPQSWVSGQARCFATARESEAPQELSLRNGANPRHRFSWVYAIACLSTRSKLQCRAMSHSGAVGCEEALSEWLQSAGVENAFTIGPGAWWRIGFDQQELALRQRAFPPRAFPMRSLAGGARGRA